MLVGDDTTKYVVSSTLQDATWQNSEIIGAYDPKRIQALKEEVSSGLYELPASTRLCGTARDSLFPP